MLIRLLVLVLLAVGLSNLAQAGVPDPNRPKEMDLVILRQDTRVFLNPDCAQNNTCSLKRIRYIVEDYKVFAGGGWAFGTRLAAIYRTDSVKTLEDYIFVQFIRGCQFETIQQNDGIEVNYGTVRDFFNEVVVLIHPDWVIDSIDSDPAYASNGEGSRYGWLQWNKVPGSFDHRTARLYQNKKPKTPELYVADHPGVAFLTPRGEAVNLSLQFKICMYKASDVPLTTKPEDVNFAEPIDCFLWNSSFVYNFSNAEFERHSEIVPECRIIPESAK